MKKILEVLSIIFIISGFLFVSCSSQDTSPKTEGTTEKGMYGEKAGEAIESAKETVSNTANEAMESAKETVSKTASEAMETAKETVSEKTNDTITDYTEKAKEQVYGYTAPEKEAAGIEGEQTKDAMTKSEDTLGDYDKKAKDALSGFGK